MEVIISIIIIGLCFIIAAVFKKKTELLRHELKIAFVVKQGTRERDAIDIASTAMILLYKKNLIRRSRATLHYWEKKGQAKEFFAAGEAELNSCIQLAESSKLIHTVVRLKDSSPALLAVGPIGKSRLKQLAKDLEKLS